MTLVDPELAARVLERALARGGDMAELYAESRRGFAISLDDGRVERPQGGRERGACVRVVQGDSTYYGYVDGLAEEDLLRVAGSVSEAVRGEATHPAGSGPRRPGHHEIATPPEGVEARRKAELCGVRRARPRCRAGGHPGAHRLRREPAPDRGLRIRRARRRDDRTRIRLSAQVVARRNGRVETGTDTRGGHAGWELLEERPEEVAEKAARRALTLLDAVDAPTGRLPVVVGNGFGGVLLHEAVGHGLEADAVQKDASVYAGRLGDRLAPEFVTAYDDGSRANAWGSEGVDDEGTPTRRTTVIEEGRLTSYLYDLLRARKDGVESTGNGRRESFRQLPIPRMTNTFFAPGDATPDDLIGGVERGLYAVSFGGGQVEPATGDFVFGVSEGYLIENGKVTAPVRGATLVGNGLEALRAIDGIAGDLAIATGYCGKGGQTVPAGVGQPHVRIRELTVGGTAS